MSLKQRATTGAVALAVALVPLATGSAALADGRDGHGRPDPTPASEQFVERNGQRLVLDHRTFRFVGTNQYYLMYSEPVMTDAVIEKAAANDFTVLRAWAFFDIGQTDGTGTIADGDKGVYFHYWDPQAGAPAFNDGANGLEKLDYVVAKAAEEGVRLVLPLTNNWANFGGIDQYNAWAGAQYHSDFYTDPTMRQWYQDWISHLLNRVNTITGVAYKDDPTIMAWELANEPRCGGSGLFPRDPGCNSDTLTAWVDEMSTYIKSIDDNHLVGTGDEGFLCDQPAGHWTRNCADGVDAARFAALPTIDYLSYHLYPDSWGTDAAWGTQWIELHNALARQIHKPAVLGEFGWQGKADRNVVYNDWLSTFIRTGGTGALYWLLSDIRGDGTLYPDYDGFTVYCPSPVCTLISNASETIRTNNKQFPPVADNDTATTDFGVPVQVNLVANDVAYQVPLRPRTVDLDPVAHGRQAAGSVAGGTYGVDNAGVLTFTPAEGFAGRATLQYTVADARHRVSNAATVTVTVKPAPEAPQVLFDFSDGAQGWVPGNWQSDPGTVSASDGTLTVASKNAWFGAALPAPVDMSTRAALTFDLVSTTGANPDLALKVGPSLTWCQVSSGVGWTTDPRVGDNAVTFDLTGLDATCTAGLSDVREVLLFLHSGTQVIDNVTVQ